MRRQLLLIVGLVLLVNTAGWAYVHYPPWLRVEPPEELDVLPAGSRVKTTLALRNAGLSPLRIQEVRVSCGCMATRMSQDVVPYSQAATLTVEWEAQVGDHTLFVLLSTNDPQRETITIPLRYRGAKRTLP
jgi:hypothetical protein